MIPAGLVLGLKLCGMGLAICTGFCCFKWCASDACIVGEFLAFGDRGTARRCPPIDELFFYRIHVVYLCVWLLV